jgi:hypothetical protein
VGAVTILVQRPLVRLYGDVPPLTTAAAEGDAIFLGDAVLPEVVGPTAVQSGVEDGDVDTLTRGLDDPVGPWVARDVGHVNLVQAPCRHIVAWVLVRRGRSHGLAHSSGVGIGGGDVGPRLHSGKVRRRHPHRESFQVRELIDDCPVPGEIFEYR